MSSRRAALVTLLLLCGCGGGVTAERWADRVCGSVSTWQLEVSALTAQAQQEMTSAKSPTQARESLLGLLGGAETSAETTRVAVSTAGVPDVDRGASLARHLGAEIGRARDAYGKARKTIESLPTADEKVFYDGVAGAMELLKQEYQPESANPAKLDSTQLKAAFAETACNSS